MAGASSRSDVSGDLLGQDAPAIGEKVVKFFAGGLKRLVGANTVQGVGSAAWGLSRILARISSLSFPNTDCLSV